MASQRIHTLSLFWTLASCLCLAACTGYGEQDKGFELCVTLRRRFQDLSNQHLDSVPSNLPVDTQYLDISYNNIVRLNEAPFAKLAALCCLKVTHCGVQVISPDLFDHIPGIQVLNISYNSLATIPDLPLLQLKILDLTGNLYKSYQLPKTFENLSELQSLSLGSEYARSVNKNDFAPLKNTSLMDLFLGSGTKLQRYDTGSLAQLPLLKRFTLNVPFCETFDIFEQMLVDLNETKTTQLTLVKLLPDLCIVFQEPFRKLVNMPNLKNLTIRDTWVNSSLMVKFLKNVWLAPLQKISFVNITYNEDTPDGVQLPSINQTVNIRSIIFDGVLHYQYKYPVINISVDNISKMTYLKFSGTGMNIVPCKIMSALPSLEMLDLSNNLLKETGFWWAKCMQMSVFPKLRQLYVARNRFTSLSFISQHTHRMKALQSLDLSSNSIRIDDPCSWPTHLTELSLSNNNLGNSIFEYLSPHFRHLDLSKTGITAINQDVLQKFPKLTHLLLSSNGIQFIAENLHAPTLITLYVDKNAITAITMNSLKGLPNLQKLMAGNNPFTCTCDSYWFVNGLNKSLLPDWPLDYTCGAPSSLANLPLSEYNTSKLSCNLWLQSAIILPVTLAITVAFGVIFYVCDGVWYTKMIWVWIRVKRRGQKRYARLMDASFQYHAFISYSKHDSTWVSRQLVPSLEGAGLHTCVHERDFVPGEWIMDNIINCVEASYKTLFVLTNNFVQSEWCNYELFFAQHRAISIQDDSLVFILLEPIPTHSVPKKFLRLQSLLKQQTYLEWPKDERKQQVFWKSLRSMLKSADKHMVLKDVAMSLSDTLPQRVSQE